MINLLLVFQQLWKLVVEEGDLLKHLWVSFSTYFYLLYFTSWFRTLSCQEATRSKSYWQIRYLLRPTECLLDFRLLIVS